MGAMDELLAPPVVRRLAEHLRRAGVHPGEVTASADAVDGLKLRQRVDVVRDALLLDLPADYPGAAAAVRVALTDDAFSGWTLWPVSEAVVDRALVSGRVADFDDAMHVLTLITPRLTSEFAIRGMLVARLDRTLDIATTWTAHDDEHVRRLASEGTRSHLPWAKGVPELVRRPGITRPVVDALRADASEYVRRSVANHVNDLSRDDPDLAAEIVGGWAATPDDTTARVSRHALRTLVKKGHPHALEIMGFTGSTFDVDGPHVDRDVVALDSAVGLTARITNHGTETARAAIDYVLHFQKARGGTLPKVFKIGVRSIEPGQAVDVATSYSFHARTTRTFHLGGHAVELQVNGVPFGRATFELVDPAADGHP